VKWLTFQDYIAALKFIGQVSLSFRQRAGPIVVYNCTNKCSQNCLHCYGKTGLTGELDTSQTKGLLKQLAMPNAPLFFSAEANRLKEPIYLSFSILPQARLPAVLSTNGVFNRFSNRRKTCQFSRSLCRHLNWRRWKGARWFSPHKRQFQKSDWRYKIFARMSALKPACALQ